LKFTKQDLQQIDDLGISMDGVRDQLEKFIQGIPFVNVVTAASIGNGIENIGSQDQQKLIDLYESEKDQLEIVKFVPASGAASRMFKFLHEFLDQYDPKTEKLNAFIEREEKEQLSLFMDSVKEFAFNKSVREKIRELYPNFKHNTKGMRSYFLVRTLLEENGLNFNHLPKGLIPFHKYNKYATTAFEEQLFESAFYASVRNEVYLHFTFAEQHINAFKEKFDEIQARVEKKTRTKVHISYSIQNKNTNTLAVDESNMPIRDEEGQMVFRPSGHGALIQNLNEIDADILFLKNIDNVVAEGYVEEIAYYKKLLAGKLVWIQKKIFRYLKMFDDERITDEVLKELRSFLWNELNIKDIPDSSDTIRRILNRPLRVCGVVKNTGEPGGGPFWVKNERGETTLQIVEISQIDTHDSHQNIIVNEATHFNPVDIVCGVRDYKGNKFDLMNFRDPMSGIITRKSLGGNTIKALELPGLWNGAMSDWNTTFVEVPLITFNPVKTVNDLLKKEHRPNA
jgi:hypothetical protein